MTYQHSMTCYTEGIRALAPARWRGLDGLMSVYWDAEGQSGARGYYLSPDPRIVIFFNDVSPHIRMTNREGGFGHHDRPMTRAIYVPAGVPLWTNFSSWHRFSHLDIHLQKDRLLRFLSPCIGTSAAAAALRRPVETQEVGPIEPLASLLASEISCPSRHAVFAESLVGSIVAALLHIPSQLDSDVNGRLTRAQINKLNAAIGSRSDLRMTVSEMAGVVGLSESWFAAVFKQTTGKTPLQWQLSRRIERAKELLADDRLTVAEIAVQLGFSDQAHLTKVFRQIAGDTPAAWRRIHKMG